MSADARNQFGDAAEPSGAQLMALKERVRQLETELAAATERETLARTLLSEERKLRLAIDRTSFGVWALDAEGHTTFVNPAVARMLGYTPEQMLGRHLFTFMTEEARAYAAQDLERRRRGVREAHAFSLRHADGHEVETMLATSPLEDEHGRYLGALALVTDWGARNEGEAERDQELSPEILEQQKTESLGVLAGGIAHDFNNLLAAIMGHVEIAGHDVQLAPRTRTALANALSAAQRAAGLTRQLLDYAGRSKLALKPLRLSKQTGELIDLLRASVPKRVTIELSSADETLSVMADPDRLQQATMNLVLNAAEAYGEGSGTVSVRVEGEHVGSLGLPWTRPGASLVKPGEYVYLEVRDRAAGMDEATVKRIFEPFFTTKKTGRGLGLAATLGIVRNHGGHLLVRSRAGEGTTFRAYFPRSREAEEAVMPTPPQPITTSVRSRTLLVVDDEPMVREFAQRLLEAEGYRVLGAASGTDALALLRERLPEIDCVLLDVSMPGMDGDTLLSSLRAFAPALPVIVHSGHSLERTSERLRKWNIAGVLQKPYRAARLSEMVRSVFGTPAP